MDNETNNLKKDTDSAIPQEFSGEQQVEVIKQIKPVPDSRLSKNEKNYINNRKMHMQNKISKRRNKERLAKAARKRNRRRNRRR